MSEHTEIVTASTEKCPICSCVRTRAARFCESCQFDFTSDAGVEWSAIVIADRDYYDRQGATKVRFPAAVRQRVIPLEGTELRIGRGSTSRNLHPEIEIDDPGISRLHAVLLRSTDGSYGIVDRGSTNGTTMNESVETLQPDRTVPLTAEDRIHLGAWTTIVIRRRANDDSRVRAQMSGP